jgi:hypothetical protein
MSVDLMADGILGCVLAVLREQGACTIAGLKVATFLGEVPVTIAIRNLQNAGAIEHGYLTPDGDWLEDFHPDEHDHFPIDAWRICK